MWLDFGVLTMKRVFLAVAIGAVASSCQQLLGQVTLEPTHVQCGSCPRDANSKGLGARLSPTAKVYYPCSEGFEKAKSRWSMLDAPDVKIVVVPGVEEDVDETVGYALWIN